MRAWRYSVPVLVLFASLCVKAWAQTPPAAPSTAKPQNDVDLPTIRVSGERAKPRVAPAKPARVSPPRRGNAKPEAPAPVTPSPYDTGAPNVAGGAPVAPQLASQMTVSGKDLNARPVTRPGEILEAAPGLAVVDACRGGKANQYYLRGWNLDHGTDLATFVDDVPINLPTHAHGQGYTDLNWLIPETISGMEIRKGPYFADVGDFANAGDLHIGLRDSVDKNIESVTVGSFGYDSVSSRWARPSSATVRCSMPARFNVYNGPWDTPDDMQQVQRTGALQPGHRDRRLLGHRDGLQQYLELDRSGAAARHRRRDRSDFTARSIRPTAATPVAIRSPPGWQNPTPADRGRPTPTWSNNDGPLQQLHLVPRPIRSTATSSINTTTASIRGGGVSRTIDGTLFGLPAETVFGAQTAL